MLLQKTNFQFFTSTFDISQTNKARKLLGSKEAPRNSLSRPHVVFKFSLRMVKGPFLNTLQHLHHYYHHTILAAFILIRSS